jgi:glutamate-ammonia-ligase adenylyltransferase
VPTPSDLFLSPDLSEDQARTYLESLGFCDAAAVDDHLQRMADDPVAREVLGRLASELLPALLESPNPDAAAIGMSRYVAARSGRAMFLDYLREDPRALHVLTYVMGASPRLTEILIRTPEHFHWLVSQVERSAPDRQDHEEELVSIFATIDDPAEALNALRRWKRRELLRIGTRDLLRRETVRTVSAQLSDVACVAVDFALAVVMRRLLDAEGRARAPGSFAVVGTGKIGAGELSYASEIDLLYVYDIHDEIEADEDAAQAFFAEVAHELTNVLHDDAEEEFLYRVGATPWPQADRPSRAWSLEEYADRAREAAAPAVLIRARPIAGDAGLGARFMQGCQPLIYRERANGVAMADEPESAVLNDIGFLIECLTQEWQVRHGARHTSLRHTGTLGALDAMRQAGLLPEHVCRELDHAYISTRSAEHRRQLGLREDVQKQLDASRARVLEICRSLTV